MILPELVLQCIVAVQSLATVGCLINSAALEATQQLSGPIVPTPTATTKRMCDNPSNSALVCTSGSNSNCWACRAHTSALLGALSHMRLVVAVGMGTMGPLNCWVASSAAELIKQAAEHCQCLHCHDALQHQFGNKHWQQLLA